MQIERVKLSFKERTSIRSGAVAEINCQETINIPANAYATFHVRIAHAKRGIKLLTDTPFPPCWCGSPTIVVESSSLSLEEFNIGEEIGELWIFHH